MDPIQCIESIVFDILQLGRWPPGAPSGGPNNADTQLSNPLDGSGEGEKVVHPNNILLGGTLRERLYQAEHRLNHFPSLIVSHTRGGDKIVDEPILRVADGPELVALFDWLVLHPERLRGPSLEQFHHFVD